MDQALLDEFAIRRLAAAYTDAANRRDPLQAAAVYAPDGVLQPYDGPPLAGRAAIEKVFCERWPQSELIFQCLHSGLVEVKGDRAWARWWLSEWNKPAEGARGRRNLFSYQDEVVRLPEGWRFARRNLQTVYREQVDYPAKFPEPFAFDHLFEPWPPR
ncbi:MAG: nuclear transport factor 2 family protein [Caulobacteraceae bacterium]|nr:nuclear transport factor 2 family protein [Caulobacteraceae bacterium]